MISIEFKLQKLCDESHMLLVQYIDKLPEEERILKSNMFRLSSAGQISKFIRMDESPIYLRTSEGLTKREFRVIDKFGIADLYDLWFEAEVLRYNFR